MACVGDEPLLVLGVADFGTDSAVREDPDNQVTQRRTENAQYQHGRSYSPLVGDLIGDVQEHDDGLTVAFVHLVAVVAHPAVFVALLERFVGIGEGAVLVNLVDVSGNGVCVTLVLKDDREVTHTENRLRTLVDLSVE